MDIYTIGHSNYSLERLVEMLKFFNIDCVVDIRGTPYSKYNIHFNKEVIEESLKRAGFVYIYMAREFAAKRENKSSYNNSGYSDFEKVVHEEDFKSGIHRLRVGIKKGFKIVLLGAMQDPIRCHRSILVGRELTKNGFNVKHILDDYTVATQENIEEMLLEKYYSNRNQITIDNLLGEGLSTEDMIGEGYRLANREIGHRIENIN